MTLLEKQEILSKFSRILDAYIDAPKSLATVSECENIPELLTIKECTEKFKGLTDNTIRQLIARKEVPAVRTGEGKRGKLLVEKNALIRFLSGT